MWQEKRYTPYVARDIRPVLLALLVAGGAACAEVDEWGHGGAVKDAAFVPDDSGTFDPLGCAVTKTVELDPRQADVLVLLDRSGSMDTAFGSGTRYQAVAGVLANLVQTYGKHVRFGFQEMPGRQGCEARLSGGCCASPPLVEIAAGTAQAVVAALASAAPMDGNTPTAASLQAAQDYYKRLADGVDNRFVLLATDGAPNCTLTGELSSPNASDTISVACTDALTEVDAMVGMGVRVIVLGVGPGLAGDPSGAGVCLDALAHAGGVAASPGSPGFFAASDPEQLQMAIEQIFGGITRPTCQLRFLTMVEDIEKIAVYLDGKQIPLSQSEGWSLDSSIRPPACSWPGPELAT